ncbi:MAG TPA: polysaccharide biosynthesis tyrosine autokinase [Nitrospirae bacterium]|nr:polysaccharide biosynthesis tyrosine autokinase [Nitrospirota bacterium]
MDLNDSKTYYEILNISEDASEETIKKAYYDGKKMYGSESIATYALFTMEEREEIINNMSLAYEMLIDPVKRREYDLGLKSTVSSTSSTALKKNASVEEKKNHKVADSLEPSLEATDANIISGFQQRLVVMDDENITISAESYRILGSKIHQIAQSSSSRVFAITSALQGEGKTITSVNLAYIMASQFKSKTLLLECDFRKPSISSKYLGNAQKQGLVDVVKGNASLSDVILRLDKSDLYVLPATQQVQNSAELLASSQMSEILEKLRKKFVYIIVDCPPILYLADVDIISKMVDGVLLVVMAGKTARDIVTKALSSISKKQDRGRRKSDSGHSNVVGVVLNGAKEAMRKYYYHYQ